MVVQKPAFVTMGISLAITLAIGIVIGMVDHQQAFAAVPYHGECTPHSLCQ